MSSNPVMEVAWFPKWKKQTEPEYKDTLSDAMFFEPEWTKKIKQCETFLDFIKEMEGKDLAPYLSGVSISVLRYLSGHVACTKKDRPSIKKA